MEAACVVYDVCICIMYTYTEDCNACALLAALWMDWMDGWVH